MLEALKQASHELQAHPSPNSDELNSSSTINALLELETEFDTLLSKDPNLSTLSQHLSNLKALIETLKNSCRHHSIQSFLTCRVSTHFISRVVAFIESEIQAWIDRESIGTLTCVLREQPKFNNEDKFIKLLTQLKNWVSEGFNRELQDLVIKSNLNVLFFFFKFFLFYFNSKFKKKMQNGVISGVLTVATNWVVMEFCIDKTWKLENWNDKTKS